MWKYIPKYLDNYIWKKNQIYFPQLDNKSSLHSLPNQSVYFSSQTHDSSVRIYSEARPDTESSWRRESRSLQLPWRCLVLALLHPTLHQDCQEWNHYLGVSRIQDLPVGRCRATPSRLHGEYWSDDGSPAVMWYCIRAIATGRSWGAPALPGVPQPRNHEIMLNVKQLDKERCHTSLCRPPPPKKKKKKKKNPIYATVLYTQYVCMLTFDETDNVANGWI